MARPLVASHHFDTDTLHEHRFNGHRWRGGDICLQCGRPRYDHEDNGGRGDYNYSSWSVSRAIREEISQARWLQQVAREKGNAENELAYELVLKALFRVHNQGLGRYGNSDNPRDTRLPLDQCY